ncbi:MAG: methyltransferase domain-containing protein [Candidatus Thermoplasmatota archaeon]|nr:methyltransferase domain-containing protein [Candidatus Thermoplasmatota archaeon]
MAVNEITHCRICGNTNLTPVVNLGVQALSGRFPAVGTSDPPAAPLELVKCNGENSCGLLQLAHNVPLNEMYGVGYGYLSGLNRTMTNHLNEIALKTQQLVTLQEDDIVLDIGSNDGTLLKSYTIKNVKRIGIDPGGEQFKIHYPDDIILITDFFSKERFQQVFPSKQAKIITSIAMFYDLEKPMSFVSDIKEILHPEGIWVLEQSYMPTMIKMNAFDTICHEHLEYYALKQVVWMMERNNLRVFDVIFNDINGGSFQIFVCHKNAHFPDGSEIVMNILNDEKKQGFDSEKPFHDFNKRISNIKTVLYNFLVDEKKKGKTIHLYGASTKGNVLLQYCGIDYRLISFAADKNPLKNGHWTPSSHIPIFSEEFSRSCNPDYYLVLPWHFRKEFLERENDYLEKGGCFIFPLPKIELIRKGTSDVLC